MKAEGGWAAVCTEYCSISPETDETPYVSARLWDDEDVRALRLMTDEAHEHGALAGVELWHGGVYAEARESRLPPLAPSQIASDFDGIVVPKAMELADIRRVQAEWVAAAAPGARAPASTSSTCTARTPTCRRSSSRRSTTAAPTPTAARFENRARFWLEAIELVREAVGDDVRDRGADRRRHARGRRASSSRRGSSSSARADPHGRPVGRDDRRALRAGSGSTAGPSRFFEQGYQLEWSGRPARRPPSRSWWSAGSPTPTGWPRSCAAAPPT